MRLRSRHGVIALALGLAVVNAALPADAAPRYRAIPLGTLGGTRAHAWGINAFGEVAGEAQIAGDTAYHAFVNSAGVMKDLGTLGGLGSEAAAINGAGDVTGIAQLPNGAFHAFLWSGGTMTDLGTLNDTTSGGRGINAARQVVGVSWSTTPARSRAFLYANGVMQDLGNFGDPAAIAYGINSAGQVVGVAASGGINRAFLYQSGVMRDLNSLVTSGPAATLLESATAINDRGSIVGTGVFAVNEGGGVFGRSHAFIFANGTVVDLGTLGGQESHGAAINSRGQAVGRAQRIGADEVAFLYTDGTMYDLNSLVVSGWAGTLVEAVAINDGGQIAANACFPRPNCAAFLLDPLIEPTTAVPTLSQWALIATAILVLAVGMFGRRSIKR